MIGNPGRGKTHISIGLKVCRQGYRVLFKNARTLAMELAEDRDAYQLGRIERQMEDKSADSERAKLHEL